MKSYKALLAAQRNDFKSWLQKNAPKAQVVKGYDLSLNAVTVKLNGTTLGHAPDGAPGDRGPVPGPLLPDRRDDPDLGLISAAAGLDRGRRASGDRRRRASRSRIIDTGIDITHPCFSDAGYPRTTQLGDQRFTNDKVIVAKVFNNKAASQRLHAEAVQDHGTHVAGTVACNYEHAGHRRAASTIPYDIVRRRAGARSSATTTSSRATSRTRAREDILNALDAAYADGMDVVNMSLGGGASGIQDLLTIAVDNLDLANMVVAVSAGNEGPGHYTVGSPGSAARALTAGASTVPPLRRRPADGRRHARTASPPATSRPSTADLDRSARRRHRPGTRRPQQRLRGAARGQPDRQDRAASRAAPAPSRRRSATPRMRARPPPSWSTTSPGDPTAMGLGGIANEPTIPAYMAGARESHRASWPPTAQSATISASLRTS